MNTKSSTGLSLPTAVNLSDEERDFATAQQQDFTEIKEALVDALATLTERKCTGEGDEGEVIVGSRPSSKLVSGFLLPRFDKTGTDDETSDIHISTMGMDFQIDGFAKGVISIVPDLAIYVRELPSWDDLVNPRYDHFPKVTLSKESRKKLEEIAGEIIQSRSKTLPPLEDVSEEQESAGDEMAQTEALRTQLEVAAEDGTQTTTADEKGNVLAMEKALERAESLAEGRAKSQERFKAAAKKRSSEIAAIRKDAYNAAFKMMGIMVVHDGRQRVAEIGDLAESTSLGEQEKVPEEEQKSESAAASPDGISGPPPSVGGEVVFAADRGHIPDEHAAPQPIPQKWRRLRVPLSEIHVEVSDDSSVRTVSETFREVVVAKIQDVIAEWLATPAGQDNANRPGERILPSKFLTREKWELFLKDLRARRPAILADVMPNLIGLDLQVDLAPDLVDSQRRNCRICIENGASMPMASMFSDFEHAVFQVGLAVTIPKALHRSLQLDRVKPSYKFNEWLDYPGMGLNCGVSDSSDMADAVNLTTTWMPKYVQPRIEPRHIPGVPTSYADLSQADGDVAQLYELAKEYDSWISAQEQSDKGAGLQPDTASIERDAHARDIEQYKRESGYIRNGIDILVKAKGAATKLEGISKGATKAEVERLQELAAPWSAWLLTNATFATYGKGRFTDWRLFQLAFILAHIPTLASRTTAYHDAFDPLRDELSASLLYFPTGGGKSEAFFGLLIFNLFFDRLRGKHRGVTALVRYPLRLLTLQQARRLMKVLVQAELIRKSRKLGHWPFEIGFWVGSGNTPNRAQQGFGGVPLITAAKHSNDSLLLCPPKDDSKEAAALRRTSSKYLEALESFDKLRECPCCGEATGMRRYQNQYGRVGILCFNDSCSWNKQNPPAPYRVPLPFLLTDDTIYQRAPSVVLGTVDKLALIGQHDKTICSIVGMLGAARFMDPENQHLFVPRGEKALTAAQEAGLQRVSPAYNNGVRVFHDPFPSIVIQDEGHLLDESLGTFSGLFETTLELVLQRLGSECLDGIATWPHRAGHQDGQIRLAKVIAATATISDPDRQLRVLYQREPLRFPCPGPGLYESFYSKPKVPTNANRRAFQDGLPDKMKPERGSPRMRLYLSLMTNGRSHTMTTSAVVSAYHLVLSRLWAKLIEEGNLETTIGTLISALPTRDALSPMRAAALRALRANPKGTDILATLLDLHRVSLSYVTNKKGGDQIIETLQTQVERDERGDGIYGRVFNTELISGGVTIAEIQSVMEKAEKTPDHGHSFPSLESSLRNIVATSAISHGVDVDKFNAMFFAGLPSDIAEYIQASSRVGRTHVGFSMLIPTPQSRRDRYVIETHDQFHRFLERMISPPAVQRWAEKAIRRVIPSILQTYLCGVVEQIAFFQANAEQKGRCHTVTTALSVKHWADLHPNGGYPTAVQSLTDFALIAIGVSGRGPDRIGAASHQNHYRQFVEKCVLDLLDEFVARSDSSRLASFWKMNNRKNFRPPMTSLRDVDAGGQIMASWRDPFRNKSLHSETVRQIMKIIRGQRMGFRSDVDSDPAPIDRED